MLIEIAKAILRGLRSVIYVTAAMLVIGYFRHTAPILGVLIVAAVVLIAKFPAQLLLRKFRPSQKLVVDYRVKFAKFIELPRFVLIALAIVQIICYLAGFNFIWLKYRAETDVYRNLLYTAGSNNANVLGTLEFCPAPLQSYVLTAQAAVEAMVALEDKYGEYFTDNFEEDYPEMVEQLDNDMNQYLLQFETVRKQSYIDTGIGAALFVLASLLGLPMHLKSKYLYAKEYANETK